jgi:N-acetylmuramoyl-L-alanine amidase
MDYPRALWQPAVGFRRGRTLPISAIVLHSGDGTLDGDLATLTTSPKASAHYYLSRAGHVWQLVREADTAYHAGVVRKRIYSNAATIGVEQEHIDGCHDWPDAQVEAVARLVVYLRAKYGYLPVKSHAAVAAPPGRKVDPLDYPWGKLSEIVKEMSE